MENYRIVVGKSQIKTQNPNLKTLGVQIPVSEQCIHYLYTEL